MTELFSAMRMIPGWLITSLIVVFMSILNYIAFRTSVGKDISFNRERIKKNADNIGELFKKTDDLEQRKADEGQIKALKDDVRESIREFKNDVRSDINNVLTIFKKNNGIK